MDIRCSQLGAGALDCSLNKHTAVRGRCIWLIKSCIANGPTVLCRMAQVLSYGEMGAVTLPGAKVLAADGWEGPAAQEGEGREQQRQQQQEHSAPAMRAQQQQQQEQPCGVRLRASDVVLRVGGVALPAGGNTVGGLVAVDGEPVGVVGVYQSGGRLAVVFMAALRGCTATSCLLDVNCLGGMAFGSGWVAARPTDRYRYQPRRPAPVQVRHQTPAACRQMHLCLCFLLPSATATASPCALTGHHNTVCFRYAYQAAFNRAPAPKCVLL